jgi:hypothetical protein
MTRTTVQLEKQAEQAFQALEPQFQSVIRGYLDRLKLGDSLIGEVPLDIMPGCFALWLPETKHVILFQRILQKTFFGEILKIIVKLIDDKLEERLVREYFRSVCGSATPEEESIQFDPTSAQPQRWVFIVKLALTLTAIATAFLVEFGPKVSPNDVFQNPNAQPIPEHSPPVKSDTK